MATRKFKDRLKEHITDIKYNKLSTVLSTLKQKQDIDIAFRNARIIAHTSHYYPFIIRESMKILTQEKKHLQEYGQLQYTPDLV